MLLAKPGYQKLVALNDCPIYLQGTFDGFPRQEVKPEPFVQGGPRTNIWSIQEKVVRGSLMTPMYIDSSGNIDEAIKELLLCAEYPMRELKISTNYVMGTSNITEFQSGVPDAKRGFGKYLRMAFVNCGITQLTMEVPHKSPVIIRADFVGFVAPNESAVVPDPSASGMMRRNLTFADCDLYLESPESEWDTTRSFEVKIVNDLKPFLAVRSYISTTDHPEGIAMNTSDIWATIKQSVDRANIYGEIDSMISGGYAGLNMIFDFGGVVKIEFPHCVMEPTEQPIEGTTLLERTTKVLCVFGSPKLDETEGHLISFP